MSWEQLLSAYRLAADEAREDAAQPPVACPNDGEPLDTGPGGTLHCQSDGWTWP